MYKGKRILAIVPARGGSKGLPGKNIKMLNGKPLIVWTLEHIKKSRYVDELFVSTDSIEIAEVCKNYGVNVDELRPEKLAEDGTSSMDVMEYTINLIEEKGRKYDYFVMLEPTSPLRKAGDLDSVIETACDNPHKDGVITVGEVHTEHPSIIKKITADNNITKYMETSINVYQRQQFDKAYYPYGVAYLMKTDVFKKTHNIYTDNMIPFYIERWQNYEIDDIYDFACVETILEMEINKL